MNNVFRISKNSFYTLSGHIAPMVAGVISTPILIKNIGIERFGILTLVWALIGYFSLFDLGIGRALTQIVAQKTENGDIGDISNIIKTCLWLMGVLGVLGGILLAGLAPILVGKILKIRTELRFDAVESFWIVSTCIPVITLTAGYRAVLESKQKFYITSIIGSVMGVMMFLVPTVVSVRFHSVWCVVLGLVFVRFVSLLALRTACLKSENEIMYGGVFVKKITKTILKFGGWMTVTNIISPIMVNLDRFFIGHFISVGFIAYYTASFDVMSRILLISGAFGSAAFPLFSGLIVRDFAASFRICKKLMLLVFVAVGPILLLAAVFAAPILQHWLGSAFASHGVVVVRILSVGLLLNAVAFIPYTFIQAMGRPDLTAKFHLAEVPAYVLLLWFFASKWGINGIALAWTVRVSLDLLLLIFSAYRFELKSRCICV